MVANPHRLFMSVEEYIALDAASPDARYEFIDGIVTMPAWGTINHSRINVNLIVILDRLLHDKSCMVCNSNMRLEISATRYVYPDISVSCDPRDQEQGDRDSIQYPCIVIEVLSASTEAYDRGRKFDYYRACSTLREYMLVDTQQQAIDLYQRQTENLWTFHPFRSGDEVELKSINVRFPLDSVCEHVSFPEDTLS